MKRIHSAADAAALHNKSFAIDTTFVLFFLSLEFGRTLGSFGFDGLLLGITLAMVIVLPFFYSTDAERSGFAKWVAGRTLVASLAAILGIIYGQVTGNIIPDAFKFLPMTLLIVTAMASCYIQFYGLMRLRPVK